MTVYIGNDFLTTYSLSVDLEICLLYLVFGFLTKVHCNARKIIFYRLFSGESLIHSITKQDSGLVDLANSYDFDLDKLFGAWEGLSNNTVYKQIDRQFKNGMLREIISLIVEDN